MVNSRFKFRAWDYYEKKMYEVGGIDFFWGIIKLQWWHRTEDGMDRRKTKEMDMDIDKELHELFGVELMQYTGLKDKNGTEIYEGDILEAVHKLKTQKFNRKYRVIFNEKGYWDAISLDDKPVRLCYAGFDKCEVIGNIFEHKHLLGEAK